MALHLHICIILCTVCSTFLYFSVLSCDSILLYNTEMLNGKQKEKEKLEQMNEVYVGVSINAALRSRKVVRKEQ